jgi:hypothetical protein
MSETYSMPPHFPVVAEALDSPIARLWAALCANYPLTGLPFNSLNNLEAECFVPMNRNIENISAAVNQLGQKVMASDCVVSNEYAMRMVSSLDLAVAKYIDDTGNFLCRPWTEGIESGKIFVDAIMKRPMQELLDLFEQLRLVILDPEQAVARYGGTKIDLSMSLDIDLEVQAFQVWTELTGQLMTRQTGLLSSESFSKRPPPKSCFSSILAGIFLGWWLGGD